MNKRIIVTGATGMVGATMIGQMLEEGIEVTAIVRPNSHKMCNLSEAKGVAIVECDISNLLSLTSKLTGKFDAMYHFAWDGTYGQSREDVFLQESNVKYTLDAVELAHKLGVGVFVGAGSQAEFGNVEGVLSDKMPKNPVSGYGIAKNAANKLSRILCEQYGIRHCWGRIVSTYGPMDNAYTMIMTSVRGMLKGERLSFTRGEQVWDYIYSEDCARAFKLIGEKGVDGKSYIIGSGKSRLLREYIMQMRDVIDSSLLIGIGELPYYENQVMRLECDITELMNDTGFEPKVSFEEGIKKTIAWCRRKEEV